MMQADPAFQYAVTPMQIRPIRTDADHETALREIETLWGAEDGTDAGDRLDVLVTLVDAYESQCWPIAPLDPVQAIETAGASPITLLRRLALNSDSIHGIANDID